MKIGVLTGIWSVAESATLLDSLERVAALGFRYVDLHGPFHAGPIHLSQADRLAVKDRLQTLGLIPRNYVLHPLKNIASSTESELEQSLAYLQEGIDLALSWGINSLELNAGQWVYGLSRDECWMKVVGFLQRVCDYAAPREFYIAQETEPYVWFLVNDVTSTIRMMEDVDRPNFTTLVDLGHMALARECPDDLNRLGDSIIHVHFSDHEFLQHTNQVIGTGITHTGDYLEGLRRMNIDQQVSRFGYDEIVVSFELGVPGAGDQIESADDWVRRSLAYVQEIAPYMSLT
jgi:sugar phosphate isomerase/epimerase